MECEKENKRKKMSKMEKKFGMVLMAREKKRRKIRTKNIRRNEIKMGNREGGGWKKWREKEEGEGVSRRRLTGKEKEEEVYEEEEKKIPAGRK